MSKAKIESKIKKSKRYILNIIAPVFVFGAITGIMTAVAVAFYKLCAKYVIHLSELGYEYLRENLWVALAVIPALFGFAFLLAWIYKKCPELCGGGIAESIGILRGLLSFRWLRTLVGAFFLSLSSFLIGVPLGNEGPSVIIGTALGRASLYPAGKNNKAWDRYLMTGGACAGFSAATGAPISGIVFAIEEAHQRISPMIILVSSVSVMFCHITTELISPLLGVSTSLFPGLTPVSLELKSIWLPAVVGIVIGLFSVLFLRYSTLIRRMIRGSGARVPYAIRIFAVLLATVIVGYFSTDLISTGHELILSLIDGKRLVYMLVIILVVRTTLTLTATTGGITGGTFLPTLAIGAVLSALLAETMTALGLNGALYSTVLILGITACISGMMKMPFTAIIFAVEALDSYQNIFYVIAVSAITFVITEIFDAQSINDHTLEMRVEAQNEGKKATVIDTFVTVGARSFAVGKQIRDIFWPTNLFVLSVTHSEKSTADVDGHGGSALRAEDVLHVRYMTYDEAETRRELLAIVGDQTIDEKAVDVI